MSFNLSSEFSCFPAFILNCYFLALLLLSAPEDSNSVFPLRLDLYAELWSIHLFLRLLTWMSIGSSFVFILDNL